MEEIKPTTLAQFERRFGGLRDHPVEERPNRHARRMGVAVGKWDDARKDERKREPKVKGLRP